MSLIYKECKNKLTIKKLQNFYENLDKKQQKLAQIALQIAFNEGYRKAKQDFNALQPPKINFLDDYYYSNKDRYYRP